MIEEMAVFITMNTSTSYMEVMSMGACEIRRVYKCINDFLEAREKAVKERVKNGG